LAPFKLKYEKQDRQGKAAFNERSPNPTSNKCQRQGAQEDPKEKQDKAEYGQANHYIRIHN
jgi:hypothetical protein